ncbi:MAG: hypothetical protein WA988_18525 [Candidatus Nanopelagicales bacterium]
MSTNNFDFTKANMSGSNNVFGSSDFDQTFNAAEPGDQDALETALRAAGIDDEEITQLREAIAVDGDAPTRGALGTGVASWLREISGKAAAGAATLATGAVLTYYGLPIAQ